MNSVNFVGRLGKDAEQRYIPSGSAVSSFNLAVDRPKKAGEKQEPLWVTVTLWGKQAETLTPFLTKGKQVAVQGEIDFRTYQDKSGTQRFNVEVQGRQITLLGGGDSSNRADQTTHPSPPTNTADADMPF